VRSITAIKRILFIEISSQRIYFTIQIKQVRSLRWLILVLLKFTIQLRRCIRLMELLTTSHQKFWLESIMRSVIYGRLEYFYSFCYQANPHLTEILMMRYLKTYKKEYIKYQEAHGKLCQKRGLILLSKCLSMILKHEFQQKMHWIILGSRSSLKSQIEMIMWHKVRL